MTIDSILKRCSKYSGWNLIVTTDVHGNLWFKDPGAGGESWLILSLRGNFLYEVYGRMSHWGISLEEKLAIVDYMKNR